jgi:hypothetical protein
LGLVPVAIVVSFFMLWLLEEVVDVGRTHSAFQRGDQRRDPVKFLSVIALETASVCLTMIGDV